MSEIRPKDTVNDDSTVLDIQNLTVYYELEDETVKAVNYDAEQLRRETVAFETVRAGDMVGLEQAFNLASLQSEEWSPTENDSSKKD